MAILNHGSTIRTADGGQTTTTIVTASNIGSYAVASNATYYIGTTQNVFNRASGAQTLTGVSIDGNAATVTNGVYTNAANTLTATNVQNTPNNTFINTVTNANQSLTFYQATAGADAYLTFHIGSDFAAYFGLGGAENDLVYGGWSVGNNRYRILHSGNASYAWNLNQNLRTTDNVTFGNVTGAIFYDSSNTAYYIDPASTSVLNKINLNSAGVAAIQWRAAGVGTIVGGYPFYNNASYGSINIEVSDNDTGGLVIDNEGVTVYGAADNGQLFRTIDEDVYQTNGNNVANATTFWINQGADGGGTIRGSFTATTDFRAPIFYDSGNTSYY